jgi:hypothetical protein
MAKIAMITVRVFTAFAVFCVFGFSANAQEAESERPPVEKVYDRSEDKIVLEITNDMWLNLPEGVDLRPFSPGVKVYLFSDYTFGNSDVSFAWGLGVSVDNVHSNAVFIQEETEEGTVGDQTLTPFQEGYEYDKNKFVTTFIEVPLELRYIKTGRNPFKLAAGFRVGYMVSNHQKIIDTEGKRKFYDFDDMNRLRYGVSARLGVGMVQLTGFYSLVPLIEEGNGTEDLTAVSLGLSFTFIK